MNYYPRHWPPIAFQTCGAARAVRQPVHVDLNADYGTNQADALIVVAGPAADGQLRGDVSSKAKVQNISIGANKLAILTLSKLAHPEAKVDGESVKIGKQAIRIENVKVRFSN